MITINKIPTDINKINEVVNFPANNIHIVCPSLKKESVLKALNNFIPQKYLDLNISAFKLGHDKCNMDIAEIGKLCDLVNYKKHTGCLYPKFKFTIFPIYDAIKDLDIDKEVTKIIKDIVEANEVYLKSDTILFIVDDAEWPNPQQLKEQLESIIGAGNKLEHLKKIDFYFL
jgi:hypothetical protein